MPLFFAAFDPGDLAHDCVKVQVFVWKNDCPGVPPVQRLLSDLNVWSDLKHTGYDNEADCFRLKHFMGYLCRGHPCVAQMQVSPMLSELNQENAAIKHTCAVTDTGCKCSCATDVWYCASRTKSAGRDMAINLLCYVQSCYTHVDSM